MAALEMYLRGIRDSRGIEHMRAIWALRDYIRETPETDMVRAIRKIEDVNLMRHLIEAGLRPTLMKATLLHYDRLIRKEKEE